MRILLVVLVVGCSLAGVGYAESLYDPKASSSLVSDRRALSIGDTVTLYIIETASAESSSDKSGDGSVGVKGNYADSNSQDKIGVDVGVAQKSARDTAREGRMRAQLGVRIDALDAQGNLHVVGQQEITLDGEYQRIHVSGWLRPDDVGPQNVAFSSRLFASKIEYKGKPGWFRRAIDWLGL